MTPLLELEHVTYTYHSKNGEVCALSDISFQIQKAEFVAVVGPSGCGKSTLLSLIAGLLTPESGSVLLHSTGEGEAYCTKERKKTQTGIREDTGYMLQKDHLFEWRTIYQNVILGLEIQHRLNEKTEARTEKMLRDYGLWRFRNAHPSELSGGMRQRAALLRTYLCSEGAALLDEPFSALDALTKASIHRWYLEVMEQIELSTLFITHDIDEAILLSDRIYLLSGKPGHITAELNLHKESRPRGDFALTSQFLEYKKEILSLLQF